MNPVRYAQAVHLKLEAKKDDIQVSIKIINGDVIYAIAPHGYYTDFRAALEHVKFLQSRIKYTPFDPAKDDVTAE